MTEPVRRIAVTSGDVLNPAAAAIRDTLSRAAAEQAEQRGRIIAAALGLPVEGDEPPLDSRQRLQTPTTRRAVAREADASSGGGASPKAWAQQSDAERRAEAAASFEAIAQHLRQKGTS